MGFTGHIEDETGLVYMQARYYDPVIGRFLSPDPIGYQDQLNVYAYVGNDPVNKMDPSGEFGVLGAAVGGAIGFAASTGIQLWQNGGDFNNLKWGTIAAATLTGAAIGATGGLAAAAVTATGTTGTAAVATVAVPTAAVASVGGAVTQMVDNMESGKPIPENVGKAALISAAGTAVGGYAGQRGGVLLTESKFLGGQGTLSNLGKVVAETGTTVLQESISRGLGGGNIV